MHARTVRILDWNLRLQVSLSLSLLFFDIQVYSECGKQYILGTPQSAQALDQRTKPNYKSQLRWRRDRKNQDQNKDRL